jgi:hypothetical protein
MWDIVILLVLAAAFAWYYRQQRNGKWHFYKPRSLMRRMDTNGRWQYRPATEGEKQENVQSWAW